MNLLGNGLHSAGNFEGALSVQEALSMKQDPCQKQAFSAISATYTGEGLNEYICTEIYTPDM